MPTALRPPALGWANPYPGVRRPLVAERVVVASQPLAAQAGLRMLAEGGNAADAAIAAASVLAVVEPTNNGLGGDLFALVAHAAGIDGINGSGAAPRRWTAEYFSGRQAMPEHGWASVTVPGAVSAWAELSSRFGELGFERVLGPATGYAHEGFPVSPAVAQRWREQAQALQGEPGFAGQFLPGGTAPGAGERFRPAGLARTLERIAASGGRDFYEGETARRIADFARATGGALDEQDLAGHRSEWTAPLALDYQGLTLHEMPPNGQGLVALMALGILSRLQIDSLAPDSADAVHLQIEALKLAFADARRTLADPAWMRVSPAQLVAPEYLAARARLVDRQRAQEFGPGMAALPGTVYVAAADGRGMLVSLIQSNYMGFGSGVVVPGTGIALHNRGACFTLEPDHPNTVAPGKRPYHTIMPGLVTLGGVPFAAFGSTGGTYQPQGHVHVAMRLARGENPQSIVDAPRFRVGRGLDVAFEPGFERATLELLAARGHRVHAQIEPSWDFGGMQIVVRLADAWLAAADGRRDSQAAGF